MKKKVFEITLYFLTVYFTLQLDQRATGQTFENDNQTLDLSIHSRKKSNVKILLHYLLITYSPIFFAELLIFNIIKVRNTFCFMQANKVWLFHHSRLQDWHFSIYQNDFAKNEKSLELKKNFFDFPLVFQRFVCCNRWKGK